MIEKRIAQGAMVIGSMILIAPAMAQTRSARDTTTAYGARLADNGVPANANPRRVSNRVNTRIQNRISLRIERYETTQAADPTAAFAVLPDDGTRLNPTSGMTTRLSRRAVNGGSGGSGINAELGTEMSTTAGGATTGNGNYPED